MTEKITHIFPPLYSVVQQNSFQETETWMLEEHIGTALFTTLKDPSSLRWLSLKTNVSEMQ